MNNGQDALASHLIHFYGLKSLRQVDDGDILLLT